MADSNLVERLLAESKQKRSKVGITVRLTEKDMEDVDFVVERLKVTRQTFVEECIRDGIAAVKKSINKEE